MVGLTLSKIVQLGSFPSTIITNDHVILLLTSESSKAKGSMDAVMKVCSAEPLVIFSKSNCCMSYTIKMLMCSFGANPRVYELDQHPNGHEMEGAIVAMGCDPSVPAVFIGQKFVGGSNEVMSLNVQGKLKPLLIKANAIWI